MNIKQILVLIITTVIWLNTYAGTETFNSRIESSEIYVGNSFVLFDAQYVTMMGSPQWEDNFFNLKVNNKVQLGINPEVVQTGQYSGSINIRVTYEYWNSGSFSTTVVDKTLSVSYDDVNPTQVIEDLSTFVFNDAHKITVEILSIDPNLSPSDLFLESQIEVERYYKFDGEYINSASYQLNSSQKYIEFYWDVKSGAESYELEWVHINDYTTTNGVYELQSNLQFDFYLNSTRIETRNNWYRIPNIFDHGYVLFRVRAIGNQWQNFEYRRDGKWNEVERGLVSNFNISQKIPIIVEYDAGMNWGHNVSYSENGKRFEYIAYVDGLARVRQSVSPNTVTGQVVVSNVYYDNLGRPVINDLPTPVNDPKMEHKIKFNRPASFPLEAYQAVYFDTGTPIGECDVNGAGFSTNSGAGMYYSPANPDLDGENANIPDAEGFPFSRVTYLNDYTGRILRVSGYGDDLKIGSGHEVRYVYPSSNQSELNKLFGSEVGWSKHYQKIVTIDQNEQVYVQYIDMAGRVVVSYMMGPNPDALDPIATGGSISTTDILNSGSNSVNMSVPSSSITYTEYIADAGTITLNYAFSPVQYQSACLSGTICFDCVYDLTVTVRDQCGAVIGGQTISINGQTFDEICNGTSNHDYVEEIAIAAEGEYIFEKTLTVNDDSVDDYWCMYIDNETCTTPLADLFNAEYSLQTFSECDQIIENSADDCSAMQEVLESDVTPGGQYAEFMLDAGGYSSSDPTSLFYNNVYQSYTYTDEFNNPIVVTNPDTGIPGSPAVLSMENFILLFDATWAPSLVEQHHPEACYLDFCSLLSSSQSYDDGMLAEYYFNNAFNNGLLNPLNNASNTGVDDLNNSPYSLDPFFAAGGEGASYYSNMNSLMQDYITLDDNGTPISLTIWEYAVYLSLNCTPSNAINCISSFTTGSDCEPKDLVWTTFRRLYYEAKQGFIYQAQQDYAVANGCSNDCIGSSDPSCTNYANKTPRFPNGNVDISNTGISINDIINDASPAVLGQQNYDQLIADICQQSAEQYADQWLSQLSGCDFVGAGVNTTNLRNDLIALIISGCDGEHPSGASTTPPGISIIANGITCTNLDEVLSAYLGIGYEDNLCTSLLINQPGPYQTTEEMSAQVSRPLDVCACDLVYEAYELSGSSGIPIEVALAQITQVSLDDVDHILCACNGVSGGYTSWSAPGFTWDQSANSTLENLDIDVPRELVCESSNCNLDCTTVGGDISSLHTRFSAVPDFELASNYDLILTNYLNQLYNYTLSFNEYDVFLNKCEANQSNPYCELNPMMEDWAEVMTLVAYRGQLMNDVMNQVDLNNDNIVYQNTELYTVLSGNNYWSSLSGNTLSLHYGILGNDCTVDLTADPGFDFSSIVSFGTIIPLTTTCPTGNSFDVEVSYFNCGVINTAYLTGVSNCFEVSECICDPSVLTLCDDQLTFQEEACYKQTLDQLYQDALISYEGQLIMAYYNFDQDYKSQCAGAFSTELFEFSSYNNTYQYTLFYYDQAGNLVKTVAPEGVDELIGQDNSINDSRNTVTGSSSTGAVLPAHDYITSYEYNSYNQIVKTTNPDQDGDTRFWYDRYGRILASQNPVQAVELKYSYTLYDEQGRSVEVGQAVNSTSPDLLDLTLDDLGVGFRSWVESSTRQEVTITQYDRPLSATISGKFENGLQQNLRLRVAGIMYYPTFDAGTVLDTDYESAIFYSYDLHGNVIEVIQDVPILAPVEQDVKSTQYEFQLISGNVKKVSYQKEKLDYIEHSYEYDALNRLEEVFTTTDNVHKSREAHYYYYDYGPLARVETGQYKVQGSDYAYTINGWLKGMNSSTLNPNNDMGHDGVGGYYAGITTTHSLFAQDLNAYTIGYFDGDYNAIGNTTMEMSSQPTDAFDIGTNDLYNGNISHLVTSIYGMTTMGSAYKYDQLQRLKEMTAYYNTNTDNTWTNMGSTPEYYNAYSYDKNGNILNLQRNATVALGLLMDNFEYKYNGLDGFPNTSSNSRSNRLDFVNDTGLDDAFVTTAGDIKGGMATNNYTYDKLGQLTADVSEGILKIDWRSGDKKIRKIIRDDLNSSELEFLYNPFGQRVLKIERTRTNGNYNPEEEWNYTYYSYDANGQVMATYDVTLSTTDNKVILDEQHIYGGSRLGMRKSGEFLFDNGTIIPNSNDVIENELGLRNYECVNYLGNVQVVITDRKRLATVGSPTLYESVILMTSDYYPFGMAMPGRSNDLGNYRYAYNGMELDIEVAGNGNSYTTEFRQYDPRLGRWKSLDPLMAEFPNMSPYVAFNNNPVYFTDVYGLASNGVDPEKAGIPSQTEDSEGNCKDWSKGDKFYNEDSGKLYKYNGSEWNEQAAPKQYFMNDQGFWIEGDSNFGEYVGNVKPSSGQGGYMEIEKIQDKYYHKNTDNMGVSLMNGINGWFGGDPNYWGPEKKEYNHAEESFNNGLLFAAEFYVSGLVIGKLSGLAARLLKSSSGSIWKMTPFDRGFFYEEVLKANLRKIPGYPVIDDFIAATGKATSVKTLDLGAKTYLKSGKAVFNKVKGYVDDLYDFQGAVRGGVNTTNGAIKSKVLELGIPRGATAAQIKQLNQIVKYADSKNITLIIRIAK